MRCERVGVWTCRGGLQDWKKMRCESGFGLDGRYVVSG
jgi:hypothetical protein